MSGERQRQALALHRGGADFQAIAEALGYASRSGAWKAVRRAQARELRSAADALRAVELARLDAMQAELWDKAVVGNLRAVDRVLAIMARRAWLLGLDRSRGA